MTTESLGSSLSDTPESQRYLQVLEGRSVTAARLSQGATAGRDTAGRVFTKLKNKRAESRQTAQDRKAIDSGEVKDIR